MSRRREGAPIKLIVYPGAYHAFDSPALKTPKELFGHRLEYNQAAADQSAVALREFLDAMLRAKESGKLTIKAVVFDAYGTLYDVQSVADVTEEAFPGYGEIITQIWRIKQLEYSWLRSLMRRYADFAAVTRDSLAYTLRCLGLQYDSETFDAIIAKYRHLDLYHDARIALDALEGTQACDPLQWQPGDAERAGEEQRARRRARRDLERRSAKVFKPSPDAYTPIESELGVKPADVLFVSSNPWDACGAKSFGLNVAWIERVTPEAMALACVESDLVAPLTMFKAIRTQMDELGIAPDHRIRSLSELPGVVAIL